MLSKNEVKGKSQQSKNTGKSRGGELLDDTGLEGKGKAEQMEGKVQQKAGNARRKVGAAGAKVKRLFLTNDKSKAEN